MKMNTLEKLYDCMANLNPRVELSAEIMQRARLPIERMLQISSQKPRPTPALSLALRITRHFPVGSRPVKSLHLLFALSLAIPVYSQTVPCTNVQQDGRVTFHLKAPNAKQVCVVSRNH